MCWTCKKDGVQSRTLFCEGQRCQDVFLVPARGSSPAAGDAPAFPPAWGPWGPQCHQQRDGRQEQGPPSSPPESMQQHCTPCSIHGAVKLKVTRIGFTPASITAAPCTETPTGVSLHTRASTSPVVPTLRHCPADAALLWASPTPVTQLVKRSSSSPTLCYPRSAK